MERIAGNTLLALLSLALLANIATLWSRRGPAAHASQTSSLTMFQAGADGKATPIGVTEVRDEPAHVRNARAALARQGHQVVKVVKQGDHYLMVVD